MVGNVSSLSLEHQRGGRIHSKAHREGLPSRQKEQRDKPEMRVQKESPEVELKGRERDLAIQRQG